MDMGLDLPITKLLAEDRARQDDEAEGQLLSTTLQLYGVIGLAGMLGIVLLASWFARSVFQVPAELVPQAVTVFRLAGIGFLGSVGMSWGRATATGLQRYDLGYSVSVVLSTSGTLMGLGAVYLGHGVVGYVLTRTVCTLLAGPIYYVLMRRIVVEYRFRPGLHRGTLRRVRGYVGYGAFNRITSSLVSRLDQTLIGISVGVAAAGVYAVPFMVVNSVGYMLAYMLGFIFPMASELQTLGEMDRLREIYFRASRFIAALAGMIFVPLMVLGDCFLSLWTPTIAAQASSVLRLLAMAGYVGTLAASLTNSLVVGLGRMRQFTIYTTIRAAVLAALCVALIPPLGLPGAGWALLLTCGVDVVYFTVALRRYLLVSPLAVVRAAYLKPVLLAGGLGGVAYLLRPLATSWLGLVTVGALLALAYVTAGFAIGVFGITEKRAVTVLLEMAARQMRRVHRSRDSR
jgi:O-antigen/teichoic acid export membrane protein